MDAFLGGTPGVEMETRFIPALSVELTATTQLTGDKAIEVICDPARSDPKALDGLYALESEGGISTITLQFQPGYKINRPQVALIRIAYLLAFSQFGYGFLMNANLIPVRNQIQNSNEKLLPSWGLLRAEFPDSMVGVSIVRKPEALRSFLVVFDLRTDAEQARHGVLLPGPTEPGLRVYNELARLMREKGRAQVTHTVRMIPDGDYLTDSRAAFVSHFYWEERDG
jgi:hypothetical protein